MHKGGFFPKLIFVNLLRSGRYYGPYLLSCGALAAMYYILRFLTWNAALQTVRGARTLQAMMFLAAALWRCFPRCSCCTPTASL